MAALYPNFPVTFSPKVNLESIVVAEDVNRVYEEVTAIAATVGLTPQTRSTSWGTGTFNTATTTYSTLAERLRNSENGTFIVYNDYVSKSGGTTISSVSAGTVSLIIRAKSDQTADLLNITKSDNSPLVSVTKDGLFRAVTIDGGSA